jgi:hypothetical protein
MAIKKSNFACVYMQNINQYNSGKRCGPWASCFKTPINSLNLTFDPENVNFGAKVITLDW